ncbi:hypothetical protein, partial [Desulfosarcina cetonica]|uniref:hypothetical protein n=1 Tax=Desulfosarcina cetonica TaxID=90730 RepID=UPI001C467854
PEMANLPDILVPRILSSEYQPYACGKIFRAPRSRPNFPISGWALSNVTGGFPGKIFKLPENTCGIPASAKNKDII